MREQQEWRTRLKELQNEIKRRKQEGEVGLTLRGLHIIKSTHSFLWANSISCMPLPSFNRKKHIPRDTKHDSITNYRSKTSLRMAINILA